MSTWVLLRGLTREARHWGDFPSIFESIVQDVRIVTPDLPGNGTENHLTSPLNVRGIVESCRNELGKRSISPPYHILGLSLGAMVAVEWATRYPLELLPCVLINTSLRPFNPFYQRLRPRNYLRLIALASLHRDAEKIERAILHTTSSGRDPQPDVIAAWVSYRKQYPVTDWNTLRQLIAAARYCAPLEGPDVPLLILAGLNDALVDPRCSQRISSHWGAALRTHNTAGHDLPLDDGLWVARQVQEWLKADSPPLLR